MIPMAGLRKSSAETKELVVEAAASLIVECRSEPVSVVAVMRRAEVSRTAFYRLFDSVYEVYGDLLERVEKSLFEDSGSWAAEPDAVGSPDVVRPNILGYARSFSHHRELLTALYDAGGCDQGLRKLWHERLVQPFIDTTAAAIARDQAAGVVSADLDPAGTALALTLLSEGGSIELLGRQGVTPEAYADVMVPIWISVLFGSRPDTGPTR